MRTAWAEVIFQNNEKMIAILKNYGAEINDRNKHGQTTPRYLPHFQSDQVEKQLKAGIDINILDNFDKTAFFYLPSSNQTDREEIERIVELLKKHGADINVHFYARHRCMKRQQIEMLRSLQYFRHVAPLYHARSPHGISSLEGRIMGPVLNELRQNT
jgi:hypothetical protein